MQPEYLCAEGVRSPDDTKKSIAGWLFDSFSPDDGFVPLYEKRKKEEYDPAPLFFNMMYNKK